MIPKCPVYTKKGYLQYILSSFPKACYWWRHNQALKAIADATITAIRTSRYEPSSKANEVKFGRAGTNKQSTKKGKTVSAILSSRLTARSGF